MMNLTSTNRPRYNFSATNSNGRPRVPTSSQPSLHSLSTSNRRETFRHWPDPPAAPKRSRTSERKETGPQTRRPNSVDTRFRRHVAKPVQDVRNAEINLMYGDNLNLLTLSDSARNLIISDKGDGEVNPEIMIEINADSTESQTTPNIVQNIPTPIVPPTVKTLRMYDKGTETKQIDEPKEKRKLDIDKNFIDTKMLTPKQLSELIDIALKMLKTTKVVRSVKSETPVDVMSIASQTDYNRDSTVELSPIESHVLKNVDTETPWWMDGKYLSCLNFYTKDGEPLEVSKISGSNIVLNRTRCVEYDDIRRIADIEPAVQKKSFGEKEMPTIKKPKCTNFDLWVGSVALTCLLFLGCVVITPYVNDILTDCTKPTSSPSVLNKCGEITLNILNYFGRTVLNMFLHPAKPIE